MSTTLTKEAQIALEEIAKIYKNNTSDCIKAPQFIPENEEKKLFYKLFQKFFDYKFIDKNSIEAKKVKREILNLAYFKSTIQIGKLTVYYGGSNNGLENHNNSWTSSTYPVPTGSVKYGKSEIKYSDREENTKEITMNLVIDDILTQNEENNESLSPFVIINLLTMIIAFLICQFLYQFNAIIGVISYILAGLIFLGTVGGVLEDSGYVEGVEKYTSNFKYFKYYYRYKPYVRTSRY